MKYMAGVYELQPVRAVANEVELLKDSNVEE